MYAWLGAVESPTGPARAQPDALPTAAVENTAASPPGDHPGIRLASGAEDQDSGLLSVFDTAARTDDVEVLERLLTEAAWQPEGRARSTRIHALLVRLAEIDPAHALGLARSLYLETRFVEMLFQTWAAADPEGALAALRGLTPAGTQRAAALALLDVLGHDKASVDRVASELPAAARFSVELDVLLARAEHEPFAVLEAAQSLEPSGARRLAVREIALRLALLGPRDALAYADTIEYADLREAFTSGVLERWAALDASGAYAWLEAAALPNLTAVASVFPLLAASDPERLLGLSERMSASDRRRAQFAALQSLSEQDPLVAFARLEQLPPGSDRDSLLQFIAQAYGRSEPDSALTWARSIAPLGAMSAVIGGVAAVDVDRAMDFFLGELNGPDAGASGEMVSSVTPVAMLQSIINGASAADMDRLINRLIVVDDPELLSGVSFALSRWGQAEPEAALQWAVENADAIDPHWLSSLAQVSTVLDGEWALAAADRLPLTVRDGWVAGVARAMAQSDPTAAASLLGRVTSAEQAETAVDPVARMWTQRDPAAAAAWARGLDHAGLQRIAVVSVTRTWARTDIDATQLWITTLPGGVARDAAIDAYLSMAAAQRGSLDTHLLDAYSSEGQRQEVASRAILEIGRNNVDEARRLMDEHITDSALRRQMERRLARTGSGGMGGSLVPPIVLPWVQFGEPQQ